MYNVYMRGLLLTILFLSVSCTKWAKVEESNGIHKIENIEAKLHSLKNVEWKVGKKRGATVSKGFQFKVEIPKIDSDGRDTLLERYNVDRWLFKVSRLNRGRKQQLGMISFDLSNMSRTTTDLTIHVFYHAASVSQSFRRFHCPAFGHRLFIDDLDLESDTQGEFNLYTKRNQPIRGKITKPAFAPVIFSGGRSLEGKYFVEIALYSSKDKRLYTPFKRVSNTVEVDDEKTIPVPSCVGVKEEKNPLPSSKGPSIRDLEIK